MPGLKMLTLLLQILILPLTGVGLVRHEPETLIDALQDTLVFSRQPEPNQGWLPKIDSYAPVPQVNRAQRTQLWRGFQDAIIMASVAAILSNTCDPTFLRYFEADDLFFVRDVFVTIADIADGATLPDALLRAWSMNPKYVQLTLSWGDNRQLAEDEKECQDVDSDPEWAAYTTQFGDLGNEAWISICEDTMLFPSLAEIENPQHAGPGCDGLGSTDSGWMTSLGGHILHELIHWRFLLQDVEGYDNHLKEYFNEGRQEDEWILHDFDGGESSFMQPIDGYGPVNTHLLVSHANGDASSNADNFRWYAQSKYWEFRCGRAFGAATNNDDRIRFREPPESSTGHSLVLPGLVNRTRFDHKGMSQEEGWR